VAHTLLLVGALLLFAGGAMLVRSRWATALHSRALAWPQVPAVVTKSALREISDGDGMSYKVEISCAYEMGGQQYTTSRHTDGFTVEDPVATARVLAAEYPGGKPVFVSVHPSKPSTAVLMTGAPHGAHVLRRLGRLAVGAGAVLIALGAIAT
jgi:Protein of unknown function (DUF3592)